MSDSAETDLIVKYIDGDPRRRLKIALAIHDAFAAIRGRIISRFILQLKDDVITKLGSAAEGWVVAINTNADWTKQKDNQLWIRKDKWIARCYVGLSHDKWGPNDLWVGIWGLTDHPVQIGKLAEQFPDWPANSSMIYRWLSREFGGKWEMGNWMHTPAIVAMSEGVDGEYHLRLRDRLVQTARSADDVLRAPSE